MRRTFMLLIFLACSAGTAAQTLQPSAYGRFSGPLDLRMSRDGRNATLLAPFEFVDQSNKTWLAPKGTTVNGASIPQVLWSVVGSPWTGKYREASVVHDFYCDSRTETWQAVHRVFSNALLTNGVGELQAKVMYAAVYRFGPRWNFTYAPVCTNCLAVPYKVPFYRPEPDVAAAEMLKAKVLAQQMSLEEIEKEGEAGFQAEVRLLELGTPQLIR